MFTAEQLAQEIEKVSRAPEPGRDNLLHRLRETVISQPDDQEIVNIVDYVKAWWGIAETPFPVQEFILKVMYGLPLDHENKVIRTWDRFKEACTGFYTEAEFLDFLYQEGRCNISLARHQERQGLTYRVSVLRLGRRAGKTSISQWITGYTIYRLLRMQNPQAYYGIRKDQPIRITLVSTTSDQAQGLLAPARATVQRSPYLSRYIEKNAEHKMNLVTDANIACGQSSDAGLVLTSSPCSARSLRGPGNVLALLEEYGCFYWELGSTRSNRSDKRIYEALSPSLSEFKNPVTGTAEGQMLIISTPLSKDSHMWELEEKIKSGEIENGLVLHLPSAWVSNLVDTEALKHEYSIDPISFTQELEAIYLDQLEAAFTEEILEACRAPADASQFRAFPHETVHMGVDLGLVNDGTAITIVAANHKAECRVIHHEYLRAGMGLHSEVAQLDLKEIAKRVDYLYNFYGCSSGLADQWEQHGLSGYLATVARNGIEFESFNQTSNDKVARNCIQFVNQARVKIYADRDTWQDPNSLMFELLRLQRSQTASSPPKISLRAPNIKGRHDDQYSAFSRALWAATQWCETRPVQGALSPQMAKRSQGIKSQAEDRQAVRRSGNSQRPGAQARPGGRFKRF